MPASCSFRISVPLLSLCWAVSSLAGASEPAIRTLDVRGLRVGGTTTITVEGDDFGKAPRLLLPFPAKQTLEPGNSEKKATFKVSLPPEVEPGYHPLRLVSESGVSLPSVIGVDRLPQQLLAPTIEKLPVALHGNLAGGTTTETKFQGKAKQRVMIEVEAQRIGSKLRPIIHLHNSRNLQIAWAWFSPALFGDARLEAVLPENGTYTLTVHDAEYNAPPASFFRLKVGEWSSVDQVFPPVLAINKSQAVELLSAGMSIQALVQTKTTGFSVVPWPKEGLWSGPRPFVAVSSHVELVQQPTSDKPQVLPEGRVAVSGRLLTPHGEDRYRVPVTPGRKVRLEVYAERIGSPLDMALIVRNEKGDALLRVEDSPGSLDPLLEYPVPEKVTSIIVGVVESQGRAGKSAIYRLTIEPQPPGARDESFKLTTSTQRVSLPANGRVVVPVQADRQSYRGKIELAASGDLPRGISLSGATIPEGADGTLLSFERKDEPFNPIITSLRGRGTGAAEAPLMVKGHPLERLQPWLASEIALAPTSANVSDFAVEWRDLPAGAALVPGSKLLLPVKISRTNAKTTVKLTLLTSQATPLVNNQPDPNKALRQEKPVEVASNVTTGDVTVLAPVELSSPVYDVTVQAELVATDKKVLAMAFAPVRRLPVRMPLLLSLSGPDRIEVSTDPKKGTTVKIQGKIERREGLKSDIIVTLVGLPAGAKADPVTVRADVAEFALNVILPPTIAAGEIKDLKVFGSFAPDAKLPNVRVRSREAPLTLVLKAPTK